MNCVDSLLRAYRRTGDKKYFDSVIRCADWVVAVKKPGQGWAQQYDGDKIADARKFEPPGLTPGDGTRDCIEVLKVAYDWTGDPKYLEPIPDAVEWLKKVQISPGKWARFYHPDTGKPWYRTIDGRDLETRTGAKGGYTWEGSWGNEAIKLAEALKGKGKKDPMQSPPQNGDPSVEAEWMQGGGRGAGAAEGLAETQHADGGWYSQKGRKRKAKAAEGGDVSSLWIQMGEISSNLNALARAVLEERK